MVKNWKKRWFSLQGKYIRYYEKKEVCLFQNSQRELGAKKSKPLPHSNFFLKKIKDDGKKKPKGMILLSKESYTAIEESKKYAFSLRHPDLNRTYFFVGSSNEDREEWVEVIKKVVQSIQNSNESESVSETPSQQSKSKTLPKTCLLLAEQLLFPQKEPKENFMWKTHIQGLNGDVSTQMESLQNLFLMLEGSNASTVAPKKEFIQLGGATKLIQLIKDKVCEVDVRAGSAQVLGVIAQEGKPNQ